MTVTALRQPRFPALAKALEPLRPWLDADGVTEISINRPGALHVERLGAAGMQRVEVPELTTEWIVHLCERVAASTEQSVNATTPIMGAALPDGERFQCVLPPAAPDGGAISIRRQVTRDLTLDDYRAGGMFDGVRVQRGGELTDDEHALLALLDAGDIAGFLGEAVCRRFSMVISGGTSTGKTTFLNALLKIVPAHERILTIEDALELMAPHDNLVRLLASKGGQGTASVDPQKLLEASLRMRPDRLLLGELRGREAMSFLQAINTGHPGSLTTVHANSPRGAYERLALMVMETGVGLSKPEVLDYLRSVIPIVVQIGRVDGRRRITDILFTVDENRRETL